MKNLVKKGLLFGLFLLLFSFIVNYLYYRVVVATDWDMGKRIESINFVDPDYELLVLGSSLAQYGVDTELLTSKGIKAYNMGMVGSSVKTGFIQLKEYIENYNINPKYVILAVNATIETFDPTGIHPVVEFTMKDQEYDYSDIPVSKFRWQGHELFKKAFSKEYRSGVVSYGQVKRTKVVPDNSDYKEELLDLDEYKSADWIKEIAVLCDKNNIELFVVEIPTVNEYQNLSDVGPYKIKYSEGCTVNLYNFNSREFCSFINQSEDWVGLSHFNAKGAAKFTQELVRTIPLD
ncbi:hypothetical protein [Saccharicrinis sp. 156]|uniref:hypothetical protein n=1 Tax=Saccharicrinis sp. 156 TaxID=3417574 RepID=UPI003D33E566